jgi:hypothetical protein
MLLSLDILIILRLLAAKGLDKFSKLPWRHVVMIGPVFRNDWSQRAGTQAVDVFDGEKTIGGYLAWFNSELAGSLVEKKAGATYMAGCARAHGQ